MIRYRIMMEKVTISRKPCKINLYSTSGCDRQTDRQTDRPNGQRDALHARLHRHRVKNQWPEELIFKEVGESVKAVGYVAENTWVLIWCVQKSKLVSKRCWWWSDDDDVDVQNGQREWIWLRWGWASRLQEIFRASSMINATATVNPRSAVLRRAA